MLSIGSIAAFGPGDPGSNPGEDQKYKKSIVSEGAARGKKLSCINMNTTTCD